MNKKEIQAYFDYVCLEVLEFVDVHGDNDVYLENSLKDVRHKFHGYLAKRDFKLSYVYEIFKELDEILKDHRYLFTYEKMVSDYMKKLAHQMQLK